MLEPIESLFESRDGAGREIPLPDDLTRAYGGGFWHSVHPGRPHIAGNFVSTLDGVVSLAVPGMTGGGHISGFNAHDRLVMGLARAVADAVVVGAGTFRAASKGIWTAGDIFSDFSDLYSEVRRNLGKPEPPLNVVVTGSGDLDPDLRVFQSGEVQAMVITTSIGGNLLRTRGLPQSVIVEELAEAGPLAVEAIIEAVLATRACDFILTEGGPFLIGDFLAAGKLDELFMTVSPQVAGRDSSDSRPGLVAGREFAPGNPLWSRLTSVKRANNHLLMRYAFDQ
jgi:riboflavin biosynthesis pyrimidine reductase